VLGLAEVVHQEPMKMIVLGLQKMPLAYDPDPYFLTMGGAVAHLFI
jgi:hypothetical protein